MSNNNQERPRVTTGAFIVNNKGELFLMRSPKWSDLLVPPGGHIEHGETVEESLAREAKEETGLDIKNIEILTVVNIIDDENFTPYSAHFIGFQCRAEIDGDGSDVVLEDREGSEYLWAKPEELLQRDDLQSHTRQTIQDYFVSKPKKKLFAKKDNTEKINAKCEEYKAGWARAQADYQNLQREVEAKRSEWVKMSELQILEEFIPVYSNFKMAFGHEIKDGQFENWKKGIEYIMKQFSDILSQHNVTEIETEGQQFDPQIHEAVGEEESEHVPGVIVREVDAGYKMGEKVIKCAKVIVSK